jgi:type II secretory pathway pseudopilin PulG
MKSVRCVHCGLINWADAEACKRCGNSPQPPSQEEPGGWEPGAGFAQEAGYAPGAGHAPGTNYAPGADFAAGAGYAPHAQTKKRTGLAVASLVVGILSLPTFGLLFVGALAAFVMGVVALLRAKRQPHLYGGRGLAVGGIVTSVLSIPIAVLLGIITAVAIPNLLASYRAANEASAVHSVRELLVAQEQYVQTTGDGEYGTLTELARSGLVEGELVRGSKNGYGFELTVTDETCTVSATPMKYGKSGVTSFYAACGDTEIHFADNGGAPATSSDPVLATATYRGESLLKE